MLACVIMTTNHSAVFPFPVLYAPTVVLVSSIHTTARVFYLPTRCTINVYIAEELYRSRLVRKLYTITYTHIVGKSMKQLDVQCSVYLLTPVDSTHTFSFDQALPDVAGVDKEVAH